MFQTEGPTNANEIKCLEDQEGYTALEKTGQNDSTRRRGQRVSRSKSSGTFWPLYEGEKPLEVTEQKSNRL